MRRQRHHHQAEHAGTDPHRGDAGAGIIRRAGTAAGPRRPIRFDRPAARAGGLFQDAEPGSLMGAPLATATRVYGWLLLRNKLGASAFTGSDVAVVATLATQAAIAYENARLIEDSRRQAAALRDAQDRTRFAMAAAHMGVWDIDLVS